MERIKEEFYEKTYTIESVDPYNLALELVNHMTSFGHVNVTKNILTTNGPRKEAEVHFYLERKFDRYSKLFFLFKLHADVTTNTLEVSALGLNQLQIPVGGQIGDVFQKWYLTEIYPEISKKSSDIINQITKAFEKKVMQLVEEETPEE